MQFTRALPCHTTDTQQAGEVGARTSPRRCATTARMSRSVVVPRSASWRTARVVSFTRASIAASFGCARSATGLRMDRRGGCL